MAERRMFSKTIIDSDAFLDMPLSAQALYFHLSMRGDDDGFINNPNKIQRMVGASGDDMKLLAAKGFILPFESGIVVIKHWKIHNYIRSDRYTETIYLDEKSRLRDGGKLGYTLADTPLIPSGCTDGIPAVAMMDTQESAEKDRETEKREEEVRDRGAVCPKTPKYAYGEYHNVLLTDEERDRLMGEYPDYLQRIERLSEYMASTGKRYQSHYATIRQWAKKDGDASGKSLREAPRKGGNVFLELLKEV